MRAAVRVVFEPLDLGRDAVLVALEVDDPVLLLVAAALVPHRDVAVVVAARAALLALVSASTGRALVQVRVDDLDQRAPAGRRGFYFLRGMSGLRGGLPSGEANEVSWLSAAKLISWPAFRQT